MKCASTFKNMFSHTDIDALPYPGNRFLRPYWKAVVSFVCLKFSQGDIVWPAAIAPRTGAGFLRGIIDLYQPPLESELIRV